MKNQVRPIAIYLPQFHPIPENDEWWGKGFTEWTNVTKAKPLFKGHYQPHLPTDLGFYDLRVAEVREEQAAMAKEYGIHGFCYYHYWFNGRRILEKPFTEVFESGKPDFPFMLCWANENWTRTWDGEDSQVLLKQVYSAEDDLLHIQSLIPYFKDNRYIRIDNKPVVAIYRSHLLPDIKNTVRIWREEAKKHNLELYICRFENGNSFGQELVEEGGFDAAVDFQPLSQMMRFYRASKDKKKSASFIGKLEKKLYKKVFKRFVPSLYEKHWQKNQRIIDYEDYVDFIIKSQLPAYKLFPGITPGFDNSARKKKYFYLKNANPEAYQKWFEDILKKFKPFSKEENLIFINAWNEWAEGNHLEPCIKWQRRYLEATKNALIKE